MRPYYEEIDKVEAVDKYTLRIQMKEPSGALPLALAGYFQGVPMASPKSFETYGKDWVRHPTGTGPYILKEWIPGKHVILERIHTTSRRAAVPRHVGVSHHEGSADSERFTAVRRG